MFVYLLLIFEGAIRKWMFPSLAQVLFFVRDPFVLTAYVLALPARVLSEIEQRVMVTGLALGVLRSAARRRADALASGEFRRRACSRSTAGAIISSTSRSRS